MRSCGRGPLVRNKKASLGEADCTLGCDKMSLLKASNAVSSSVFGLAGGADGISVLGIVNTGSQSFSDRKKHEDAALKDHKVPPIKEISISRIKIPSHSARRVATFRVNMGLLYLDTAPRSANTCPFLGSAGATNLDKSAIFVGKEKATLLALP
ncbi:hypothetical protein L7F22_060002 [Adiantum nelumboides]|nr:hypothetical protein [Adiantum nelumboides]